MTTSVRNISKEPFQSNSNNKCRIFNIIVFWVFSIGLRQGKWRIKINKIHITTTSTAVHM